MFYTYNPLSFFLLTFDWKIIKCVISFLLKSISGGLEKISLKKIEKMNFVIFKAINH